MFKSMDIGTSSDETEKEYLEYLLYARNAPPCNHPSYCHPCIVTLPNKSIYLEIQMPNSFYKSHNSCMDDTGLRFIFISQPYHLSNTLCDAVSVRVFDML